MTQPPLQHPLVLAAMADARRWCTGHLIEERPAFRHTVAVARTVLEHGGTSPELLAAALMHDAPDLAPGDLDLPAYLATAYGPVTNRLVTALHQEHVALNEPDPTVDVSDPELVLLSTADKVVAFRGNLSRADLTGDRPAYFGAKTAMVRLLPYFHEFQRAGVGLVPAALSTALADSLLQVDAAIAERLP
ncbi:metal-dependent phosphohydrolase [Actinoplanes sp. NBRC 101535]|uniref:metal-dependent phosphohydrolase n=1 Tax=Actinoplanes sp. NBRC 101535 TaxID=3032196 RepID=UPI0024A0BC74|nr:metal-dependent phosphohydrolase [Actinoplanes sp. NBRC 101535]GLY03780.1 hypothetical protein Acsp01_41590 [Actinoplanes sp. NBRC 101535]